jgi:hypothetical protein
MPSALCEKSTKKAPAHVKPFVTCKKMKITFHFCPTTLPHNHIPTLEKRYTFPKFAFADSLRELF